MFNFMGLFKQMIPYYPPSLNEEILSRYLDGYRLQGLCRCYDKDFNAQRTVNERGVDVTNNNVEHNIKMKSIKV